jgi:predicted ribonuclease YlaK
MGKRKNQGRNDRRRWDRDIQEAKEEYLNANERHFDANDKPKSTNATNYFVASEDLLLDCPNLIYDPNDESWCPPKGFVPKAIHLIIPISVIRGLEIIAKQHTIDGMTAKRLLKVITGHFERNNFSTSDYYTMEATVKTGWKNQTITLLAVPDNYMDSAYASVPWDAVDERISIAICAYYAQQIADGEKDPTFDPNKKCEDHSNVTVLTNDEKLHFRAYTCGVSAEYYSWKKPEPFCGCRHLTAPTSVVLDYYYNSRLSLDEFEKIWPDEPLPQPNEYIVLHTDEGSLPNNDPLSKQLANYIADPDITKNMAKFSSENKAFYPLRYVKAEGELPKSYEMATYFDALNDPNIEVIIATGPSGTGKTYTAVSSALNAVRAGKYARIVVIPARAAVNSLGALPGGFEIKSNFLVANIKSAIRSFLESTPEYQRLRDNMRTHGNKDFRPSSESEATSKKRSKRSKKPSFDDRDYLGNFNPDADFDDITANDYSESHSRKKGKTSNQDSATTKNTAMSYNERLDREVEYIFRKYFICVPFEDVQGMTFDNSIVIIDEAQRMKIDDADTAFTRLGNNSKLIILGDTDQIHDSTPEKQLGNALVYARWLFVGPNCAHIGLTQVLRSGPVKTATERRAYARHQVGR